MIESIDKNMSFDTACRQAPKRSVGMSLGKGARLKCPRCGTGGLFRAYLKSVDSCAYCGEEIHHHRADDAPPYFTILIVGHIIMPGILLLEKMVKPDLWIHASIWLPLTIFLSLLILPVAKGALIGLQWALRMHGFDPESSDKIEMVPENG